MITETITWHTVQEQLPDADMTVLITLDDAHDEPTWLAFHDGATWRDVGAHAIRGVTHWADMPAGGNAAGVERRAGVGGQDPMVSGAPARPEVASQPLPSAGDSLPLDCACIGGSPVAVAGVKEVPHG